MDMENAQELANDITRLATQAFAGSAQAAEVPPPPKRSKYVYSLKDHWVPQANLKAMQIACRQVHRLLLHTLIGFNIVVCNLLTLHFHASEVRALFYTSYLPHSPKQRQNTCHTCRWENKEAVAGGAENGGSPGVPPPPPAPTHQEADGISDGRLGLGLHHILLFPSNTNANCRLNIESTMLHSLCLFCLQGLLGMNKATQGRPGEESRSHTAIMKLTEDIPVFRNGGRRRPTRFCHWNCKSSPGIW